MIVLQILAGAAAAFITLLIVLGLAAAISKETGDKVARAIGHVIGAAALTATIGAVGLLLVCLTTFAFTGEWRLP